MLSNSGSVAPVSLSSVAAQIGGVVGPHYAASKAGILGLTHSYASLLAKEGITVNAIAPALILTEMVIGNPRARPDLIPLGRFGTTEEVAEVVVMLAKNGYITGQTINVNGGLFTGHFEGELFHVQSRQQPADEATAAAAYAEKTQEPAVCLEPTRVSYYRYEDEVPNGCGDGFPAGNKERGNPAMKFLPFARQPLIRSCFCQFLTRASR